MSNPIPIFIGTSSNGEDAKSEAVLEYTLRKNTERELDITWMRQTKDGTSHWFWPLENTRRWSTPFSGYRWAIPEYCEFQGRALYMDEDQINFKDIGELFDIDMENKPMAARRGIRFGGHEFCVTLFDNPKLSAMLPVKDQREDEYFHHKMIQACSGNAKIVYDLDPRWNNLDGEGYMLEDIWHLHWTHMPTQPWHPSWFTGILEDHRRDDLVTEFWRILEEANVAGYHGAPRQAVPFGEYQVIGK